MNAITNFKIPGDQDEIPADEPFEMLEFDYVSFSYQWQETIRKYKLHSYRKLFAAAFQDVCLFGMIVEENNLLGKSPTPEREKCVVEALERAWIA